MISTVYADYLKQIIFVKKEFTANNLILGNFDQIKNKQNYCYIFAQFDYMYV